MAELSKNSILYVPEEDPSGVVQIIHGCADHQGRYREMAQFFADHGYAAVTTDIRGHGNNISRPNDLGFFGDNAVSRITGDIHENTNYIREKFGRIPYAVIGQGMGAMIAAVYFKKYDNFLNALFLSGMPAYRILTPAAGFLLFVLTGLFGEYQRSKLVNALLFRRYYSRFSDEGSVHSWLSLDRENVSRYERDARCGFLYTLNGYKTLVEMMKQAYGGISWIKKNKSCPVRIMYGSDDTCMLGRKGLEKTVALFSGNGYTDVSHILFQDHRHELFQDIDHQSVMLEIINVLSTSKKSVQEGSSVQNNISHFTVDDFVDPEIEKPLEKEERINLEEFITSHSRGTDREAKVEMIDFADIDYNSTPENEEVMINELLSEIGSSEVSDTISDTQRFLMDPNNLDGID